MEAIQIYSPEDGQCIPIDPGDGDWSLLGMYFGLDDVLFTVCSAVVFLAVRFVLVKFVFRPFGLRMKSLDPDAEWSIKEQRDLGKFCKYCWHTCNYVIFWSWALWLYLPMPWAFNADLVWISFPHDPDGKLVFKPLFLLECGWYMHGIVESFFQDSGRNDFLMVMVHHVFAVVLIWGCLWFNAHRAGIAVIVAQDISDIIVYVSKIIHQCVAVPFLQRRALHTALLTCITVSWFLTRVCALGVLLVRSWQWGMNFGIEKLDSRVAFHPGLLRWGHPNFNPPCLLFIAVLQGMHILQIIWFVGIFRMFISQVLRGSFYDMWHDSDEGKAEAAKAPQPRTPSPLGRRGSKKLD